MPEVAFIVPRLAPWLAELVDTLRYELELQGVASSAVGRFPAPAPGLVNVLVDARAHGREGGDAAYPEDDAMRRTIVLGSESPNSVPEGEHLDLLLAAGAVFDTDDRTVSSMRRLGINARPLNPGYSLSRDHYDAGAERPIDVLFLGEGTRRQTALLRAFTPSLERRNCELRFAHGRAAARSVLGPGRWSLLSRSKILINLHADESDWFETLHAFDAIHAGAVVVSEHSSGLGALEPGRDLLVGDARSLPFLVEGLLADEERLARMRADAYERLRGWIPFALSASIFRAAIVEVLGAPLPAGSPLGRRDRVGEGGSELSGGPERSEVELRLADARRELSVLRDELAAARRDAAMLKRDRGDRDPIAFVHRSPGWDARRRPRVTVLTTVLDGDPDVAETLMSVARSRTGDWELVVVVACASDAPLDTAERWARANPRTSTTVIADNRALGRGAARNVGLDVARAAFLLVLDAGATIRAPGIARLADRLSASDELTFVYPMIEVLTEPDRLAGADKLGNTADWDPELLRQGDPVRAPYLIRTGAVRDLGGFATDGRRHGSEDHDLLARIAERGQSGQLLAQLLAARAETPTVASALAST